MSSGLGLREAVSVTDPDYKGWGMVLVRPSAESGRVYQAPHPAADWFSERIALYGFLTDPDASIALFAGAHRNANGDVDGDGERDSDVTHDTENLFHVLTEFIARERAADGSPVIENLRYWGVPRNDGFVLMPNEVQAYRVGDKAFETRGTNGFMITLDITSSDVE